MSDDQTVNKVTVTTAKAHQKVTEQKRQTKKGSETDGSPAENKDRGITTARHKKV